MRYLFCAILGFTFILNSHFSHSQEDITVTAEYVGAIDGMAKYHLYANFPEDGFTLAAIYGYDAQPLSLVSEGEFHQPHWSISQAQCEEGIVSGFTIGCGDVSSVGTDWFANGDYLVNTFLGASVFVINSVEPDQDGRILIGKFITTVTGLSGTIPLQISLGGSSSNQVMESFPVITTVECDEFLGCMDPNACNWNPEAECPDASCIYEDECGICGGSGGIPDGYCDCDGGLAEDGYDCDGVCLNDEDGDGVCDEFEIAGCMDPEACDYNEAATDAVECDYSCLVSMSLELLGIIDFSTPVGGTSGKAIHLLANADIEDLSTFGIGVANNGGGTDGEEFSFPSLSVAAGESLLLVRNQDALEAYFDSCWTEFTHIVQASTSIDQNGDDAIELYEYGEVIETFGDPAVDGTGQDWEYMDSWAYKWNGNWILGGINCTDGTQTIYESSCLYPLCSSGIGCTDSEACNYMPSAATNDGSCYFAAEGYDCEGICLEDADGDGVCDPFEIAGCMDSAACNYNPLATDEDNTCQAYDECDVCGGIGIPEGDCDCEGNAPSPGYGCDGECLSDENQNDICDYLELEAILADLDEGVYCGEGTTWDAELGECIAYNPCPKDLNGDGVIGVEDLLQLLNAFGTECPDPNEPETAEWTCGEPVNYHSYDYATVQIGEQCWFAENLRTELYKNGLPIPGGLDNEQWSTTLVGAQSIGPIESNPLTHGRLYNGYALLSSNGICPNGWAVPADEDWITLEMHIGMAYGDLYDYGWRGNQIIGYDLKASANDNPQWNGTNLYGFSATAGGYRDSNGETGIGGYGYWWSSSEVANNMVWRGLYSASGNIGRNEQEKHFGYAVRCLEDAE